MIWHHWNHMERYRHHSITEVLNRIQNRGRKNSHFLSDAGQPHWCNEHEPGQSPGDGEGRIGLGCCSQWSCKELDMTGWLTRKSSLIARVSRVVLAVKDPPASAGDLWDIGSIPGSGRSPGGGNGNPLQYSCLENPMDRRAWWATFHGVTKSRTGLKQLSTLRAWVATSVSCSQKGTCTFGS